MGVDKEEEDEAAALRCCTEDLVLLADEDEDDDDDDDDDLIALAAEPRAEAGAAANGVEGTDAASAPMARRRLAGAGVDVLDGGASNASAAEWCWASECTGSDDDDG